MSCPKAVHSNVSFNTVHGKTITHQLLCLKAENPNFSDGDETLFDVR